jgi:menaquinone-dependent protoporphyrinogen oxidase
LLYIYKFLKNKGGVDVMKSLIVFCSSHGTTAKAAHLIRKHLEGDVITINLNRTKLHSDIDIFDAVIIGGSIHAGMIQRKVKKFVKENQEVLRTKQLGLFLCCAHEGELAKEQFENAYPKELRDAAVVTGLFGGEFLISQLNFLEKWMVKQVSGVATDTSKLDYQSIMEFIDRFNQVLKMPS